MKLEKIVKKFKTKLRKIKKIQKTSKVKLKFQT